MRRKNMKLKRYLSLLLAVVLILGAMPVVSVSAAEQELASVSVTADKYQLAPGETAQLTAAALDPSGNSIEGAAFSYLSMDSSIAEVSETGLVTAKDYGVIEINVTATVGEVSAPKLVKMTVADPSDKETFELEPGSVPSFFASGSTMAAVSDEEGKDSAMSVKLKDTATNSAALLRYEAQASESLELEFDVLYKSRDILFRFLNGGRSTANTAFWFTIKPGQAQYYDGTTAKWTNLGDTYDSIANTWANIRVKASLATKEAKLYINGQYIGAAPFTGGSYGGNVKTTMNSVVLECGDSGTTNGLFYADNLKLTPGVQTFEMLTPGDDLSTVYASGTAMAIISSDAAKDGTQSAKLEDTTTANTAILRFETDAYESLTASFDLLPNVGIPLFRLSNGARTNGNLAFWFRISGGAVQYYAKNAAGSGAWQNVGSIPASAEPWVSIQLEASLTTGKAKVYANGQYIGEALRCDVSGYGANVTTVMNSLIFAVGGNSTTGSAYVDNVRLVTGISDAPKPPVEEVKPLIEIELGELFDVADNTETVGLPMDSPIVQEDFGDNGFGFAQIPNALYDPATDQVYINYNRHRDIIVDYPYDSTKVYDVETVLNAEAGAQLQGEYDDIVTDNAMFLAGMTKLKDGRIFAQNYVTYYVTDTVSTTYSWIVDASGNWTKVEGTLTLPEKVVYPGPQPTVTWGRYGFSRGLIELDNGTLLASMYGSYGAILVESTDMGKTWTYRSTIADSALGLGDDAYINTDGTAITWFEPAVVRCKDGSLLAVMRTWRNKPLWQTRSYDDGLTWSEPIVMPGLSGQSIYPHLVVLSNGVLAMATGVPGDTIYFSLDGSGYKWDSIVTTYSDDTTGNAAITEIAYDAATGTSTLLALGDKGFHNDQLSGVWGRLVTVTRNRNANPKLAAATLRASEAELGLGETMQLRMDGIFDTNSDLVTEGYTVTYQTLTPAYATVDAAGLVTGKAPGKAELQATVTWNGKTVMSNKVTVEVADRGVLSSFKATVSEWVLDVGETGNVTTTAYNYFGAELSDVEWSFASEDSSVLTVDPETGDYEAKRWGVVDLIVNVTKGDVALSKTITMIIESGKWVTEDFEGETLPENVTVTSTEHIYLSETQSYSGSQSAYVCDSTDKLAPMMVFTMPETKAAIVEMMLYVEKNDHSSSIGIGHPNASGATNYATNTAYIGILYNAQTGAQGYQAYDGKAWSRNNRNDVIPHQQWNKLRFEVTSDKEWRLYCNDIYLADLPVATVNEYLNNIYFSSGGAAYTGDQYYIDDIRYMVFDEEFVPVTGVTLDKETAELTVGESLTLTASVSPELASVKDVVWTSSDETVTTVVDGVVTAVKEGEAVITVTTADGGYSAACTVKVSAPYVEPQPPQPGEQSSQSTVQPKPVFEPAPFLDVTAADWFYEEVGLAYQVGLINGVSDTEFDPNGLLTASQTIKLAAALHQLKNSGKVTLTNGDENWYDTYVDYAIANGIIGAEYDNYTDAQMNAVITRAVFVDILHGAMCDYEVINQVADDAIPDVKMGDPYADEIYDFYRAGILIGCDAEGTFRPNTSITRSEMATILIRMFDQSARKTIALK